MSVAFLHRGNVICKSVDGFSGRQVNDKEKAGCLSVIFKFRLVIFEHGDPGGV